MNVSMDSSLVQISMASSARLAEQLAVAVEQCAEAANFLLAIFHKKKMTKFEVEDRRIILRTMPPRAREVWSDYE
jgi:hypothetical protein